MRRSLWLALLLALPALAFAQRPPTREGVGGRAGLEAELRRGFARVVRERVGLDDQQMRQLGTVTQRFAAERRRLQMEERATRAALQRMLRDSTTPDSTAVEGALRRLLDVHKRRAQLVEAEHAQLATFMSPVQRARYFALQEQLRRRLEQRRMRRDPGAPRR